MRTFRLALAIGVVPLVFAACSAPRTITESAKTSRGSRATDAGKPRENSRDLAASSMRMVMPVRGVQPDDLESNFGAARDGGARSHEGLDIMAPEGRELVACVGGTVTLKSNALGGLTIYLAGDDGNRYYYAHLSRYRDGLDDGDRVVAGEVIGYCGQTGNATTPHLHFEVLRGGSSPVDPYPILRQDGILVMAMPAGVTSPVKRAAAKKR